MNYKYIKGILLLGLVFVFIISGCGTSNQPASAPKASNAAANPSPSPKGEKPLKSIKVAMGGGGPTALYGPIYLAQEKDLWKQYGLKVELLSFSAAAAAAALISNSVQVVSSGPTLVGSAITSEDVKIVGSDGKVALGLYSRVPLKLGDLKGKTIGIVSAGGSIDTAIKTGLKSQGLEPGKDVKIVYTGGAGASLASLKEGKVDAAGLTPPSRMQGEEMGFHLVTEFTELKGALGLYGILGANNKFMTEEPETMQAFMNAFSAAVKMAKSDKEATKAAIGKYTKITEDKVLEDSYNVYQKYWSPDLHIPESEVQIILDQLAETNEAAKSKKPSDVMKNRFADAVK